MRISYTVVIAALLLAGAIRAQAQGRGTYTLLQAGGLFGVSTTADQNPLHGYQFQFAFGRNFYDRVYLGLGLSNDVYRGRSTLADGSRSTRRINTLPLVVDFRAPLTRITPMGKLGAVVNAGYAPSIGADYFKGFVGKAGLTYGHLLIDGSDLLFTLGYGFQQFDARFLGNRFNQHSIHLTVGLFVH